MSVASQLQLFEPEGIALPPLVSHYLKMHDTKLKLSQNLCLAGFESAGSRHLSDAIEAFNNAVICEIAYQFETQAGLQ